VSDAADRIIGLYRRHAGAWAAARGTELMERAWLDRFTGLLAEGASVLDIGCGPGLPIARHLAGKGHAVTGIDSSPEMAAMFRANLPDAAVEVADMRTLSLGRRFGGLLAWDSFFHLTPDDQRAMVPVFGAHAAERAALMFTSGSVFGEAVGTLEGEPLYHASLDPEEYRLLLEANGFDLVAHVPDDPDCGGHTVWLARRR
jgi:SAM-dependent methyltransferase